MLNATTDQLALLSLDEAVTDQWMNLMLSMTDVDSMSLLFWASIVYSKCLHIDILEDFLDLNFTTLEAISFVVLVGRFLFAYGCS